MEYSHTEIDNQINNKEKTMTYRQLRKHLQEMIDSRLDDDVTIFDEENSEYFPVKSFKISTEENDVLDEGHAYLSY
mgnify:CR=1 FL=1